MSMPFDFGNLGNLGNLMGGLQQQVEKMKENARNTRVEGVAGGGLVRVIASGDNQIVSITIAQEAHEDREPPRGSRPRGDQRSLTESEGHSRKRAFGSRWWALFLQGLFRDYK